MKRNKLFGVFLIAILGLSAIVSCSKDDDKNGKNDPSKPVVTSRVSEIGEGWAVMEGYINNKDDKGFPIFKLSEYGFEVALAEGTSKARIVLGSLDKDNGKMIGTIEQLAPDTRYKYRAFATDGTSYWYGDYKEFTSAKPQKPYTEKDGVMYVVLSEEEKTARAEKIGETVKKALILDEIKIKNKEYKVTEVCYNIAENSTSLESVTISDNVLYIGTAAFSGCENLKEVTLGSGIREIGMSAFNNCVKLSSIRIPDKVTDISWSFIGCKSLSFLYFGQAQFSNCSLQRIKNRSFEGSTSNLQKIYCTALTPPKFENNDEFFTDQVRNYTELYVPAGKKSAYQNAPGWKNIKSSNIKEY